MEINTALTALSALAHETRLKIFTLLVPAGPEGLAAGAIADRLHIRASTLSNHLGQLQSAKLLSATRAGRMIHYAVDYATMRDLMAFLMRDCCGGRPEICAPLIPFLVECEACAESYSVNRHGGN